MDKVDEMPAGRDLDRVVAVRVMGQNVYDTPPLYSSDIGAAWEVFRRLEKEVILICLSTMHEGRRGRFAIIGNPLKPYLSMSHHWVEQADTFELAICRVALAFKTHPANASRAALKTLEE